MQYAFALAPHSPIPVQTGRFDRVFSDRASFYKKWPQKSSGGLMARLLVNGASVCFYKISLLPVA